MSEWTESLKIVCGSCGTDLTATEGDDKSIIVDPCESCVDEARNEGFDDGVEEGREQAEDEKDDKGDGEEGGR